MKFNKFIQLLATCLFSFCCFSCSNNNQDNKVRLTMIKIFETPIKLNYYEGESIELDGLKVKAFYSDNTTEYISDYTCDLKDSLSTSDHTVNINYTFDNVTKSDCFEITVIKNSLLEITIDHQPNKLTYYEGDSLDTEGLVVTGHYANGDSKEITNYTLSYTGSLNPSISNITVFYSLGTVTKSASFNIEVLKTELISITIDKNPTKMDYEEDEQFESSGLVVTAHFNNGKTQIINDYLINAPSKLTKSDNTILINYTYGDVTKSVSLIVNVNGGKYTYKPHLNDVIPSIKINTPSGTDWVTNFNRDSKLAGNIDYVDATITTVDGAKEQYNFIDAKAKVKVRGNYTLNYEKKPIRIKFEEKQMMFGMNNDYKAKSWVLLAEWKDLSMLNNSVTLYMGHAILGNDGYYNTDFMYSKVYINDQYWGLYLLAEQQEVKGKRFDVTEADETNPNDLNIGYLVELDSYYTEEPIETTFEADYSGIVFKSENGVVTTKVQKGFTIKSDIYSNDQKVQIKNYVSNCLKIIYEAVTNKRFYKMSSDYSRLVATNETNPYKVINQYVDMNALVDYFIIEEIVKDPDLPITSFYFDCDLNKDNFKPLTLEGLWDFDSALGIRTRWNSTSDLYSLSESEDGLNPFFGLFNNCPWFFSLVENKWNELLDENVFNDVLDFAKTCKVKYKDEYKANFERWSSRITNGNSEVVSELNKNHTEEDGANYLISWMTQRLKNISLLLSKNEFKTNEEILKEKEREELLKGKTAYRFEAENGDIINCSAKTDNTASGNGYLSQVSGASGRGFSYIVNSSEAVNDAIVYIRCSKLTKSGVLSDWFTVYVNDVQYPLDSNIIVPTISSGETEWHAWEFFYGTIIRLNKGNNTIKVVSNSNTSTNLDCVDIYSSSMLV